MVKEGPWYEENNGFISIQSLCSRVFCRLLRGCTPKPTGSDAEVLESLTAGVADENANDSEVQESEQAEKAAPALIEPEQLITQEEAEALLGEPLVGDKTENPVIGQKIYFYEAVDENSDQYLQISVTQQAFMAEGSASTPEQLYEDICAAFEPEAVSGVGDEAQIIPSGYQIMCNGYYLTMPYGRHQLKSPARQLALTFKEGGGRKSSRPLLVSVY